MRAWATVFSAVTIAGALAYGMQQTLPLAPGQTAEVTCTGTSLTVQAQETSALLSCVQAQGRPVPTPTGNSDAMRFWHAPGAHDGLQPHEHGAAPPDWVVAAQLARDGSAQLFGWDPIATPGENYYKHQAYKGYLLNFAGRGGINQVYLLVHAQSNPMGWIAPYHSTRAWVRDELGGVSSLAWLSWFGWTDVRSHRLRRSEEARDSRFPGWPGRGAFALSCISRLDDPTLFADTEQWYGSGGLYAPDIGISISRAAAYCDPDRLLPSAESMDMANWDPSGYQGANARRVEFSWYGRATPGSPRPQFNGPWCLERRPTEPVHTHASRPEWRAMVTATYGACPDGYVAQYTAPTYPEAGISYRIGNAFEQRPQTLGMEQPQ